ncbi:hypothetical protein VSDG_00880 [Cytospora chrysosperma]|uniref:Uncharacterized protein n=1 Tax=Cytospora chrysosperma TaxID=252740 RepID=A0A423WKR5_CYTCH|nr:hypothetical protein VSDG_00880 [Valsa sordida]
MCPSTNGAIAAAKTTNPADVHAIGHEQPSEARSAVLKNPGVADFMARVSSRLRNTQAPCLRIETRREFLDLLRGLDLDVSGEPPYSLEAAEKVRDFLVTADLGQDLLLDFTVFLQAVEVEVQKRREQAQKIAKEAAEALEEERRRKGEWDVIEKSDVEDLEEPWEMVSEAETGSDI